MQDAQVEIDEHQGSTESHMHAMSGGSRRDYIRAANDFVRSHIEQARTLLASGDRVGAYRALGYAIHVGQDATSPVHREFQQWSGNESPTDLAAHGVQERTYPREGSREQAELDGVTRYLYDQVHALSVTGDALKMPDLFDPDTGELRLPNSYGGTWDPLADEGHKSSPSGTPQQPPAAQGRASVRRTEAQRPHAPNSSPPDSPRESESSARSANPVGDEGGGVCGQNMSCQ